jgi:NAD(P)-dependent dehydrogenase (short-subunit alcohol dehydrogenase family)
MTGFLANLDDLPGGHARSKRLEGRSILVTGAAQGMGKAIAVRAAREGAVSVTLADIKEAEGQAAAREVEAEGARSLFVATDLRSVAGIETMVAAAAEFGGGLDVLVNNAGITDDGLTGEPQTLESLTEAQWDAIMDINVKAIWRAACAAVPWLKKSEKQPAIVNAASVASTFAYPGIPAYSVAKGAVKLLTQIMAADFAPYGIRCNAYAPGAISTPMLMHSIDTATDREEAIKLTSGPHLIKRLGEPGEAAALVCFLASGEASFMTGATVLVDGGTSAWRGNG